MSCFTNSNTGRLPAGSSWWPGGPSVPGDPSSLLCAGHAREIACGAGAASAEPIYRRVEWPAPLSELAQGPVGPPGRVRVLRRVDSDDGRLGPGRVSVRAASRGAAGVARLARRLPSWAGGSERTGPRRHAGRDSDARSEFLVRRRARARGTQPRVVDSPSSTPWYRAARCRSWSLGVLSDPLGSIMVSAACAPLGSIMVSAACAPLGSIMVSAACARRDRRGNLWRACCVAIQGIAQAVTAGTGTPAAKSAMPL